MALDARLGHLKSANSIRIFREKIGVHRSDRPKIVERRDVVVVTRLDETAPCDQIATNDPCERATGAAVAASGDDRSTLDPTLQRPATLPIWPREQQTRPVPPPLRDGGVFWPRAVQFLIAVGITAALSYYFAGATSSLNEHLSRSP